MRFDFIAARQEGYSDDEIAEFLAKQNGFDLAAARAEGYKTSEILEFLAEPPLRRLPAAETPVAAGDPQFPDPYGAEPAKRTSSVLEGVVMPEPRFDPAEGERLSRRSANEPQQPRRQLPGAEIRQGREVEPRSAARAVADTALGLGQGAVSMVKGVADNVDAGDNAVSRTLEKAVQGLEYFKSDALRDQAVRRDALISTVQKNQGELAAARAALNSIGLFPAATGDVAARGTGSLIPTVAMGVAGLGPASMWATNALANAGDAASQTADALRRLSPTEWQNDERYLSLLKDGQTHEQAVATLAPIYALPAQALGGLTGFLSGRTGLERVIAGRGVGAGMRARAGAAGAEALGEQAETLIPQAAGNLAVGAVDQQTGLTEGLGRAAVDTAVGSAPGAAIAAAAPVRAEQPVTAPIAAIAPAQTTDEAIIAAARALDAQPAEQAVANIERILGDANVSTPPAVPRVDSGAAGGGMDLAAAGLGAGVGAGVGADGAAVPAVDARGPADQLPAADLPQPAGPDLDALRGENAALRSTALQALEAQQVPAAPADAVPVARVDESSAQLPAAGSAEVEAGGVAPAATPAVEVTRRNNGTVVLKGDTQQILAALATQGLTGIPGNAGVIVAKSQAQQAATLFQQPEAAPNPEEQRAEFQAAEAKRQARASRLRAGAFDKNPLMAFLGKHGISLQLASEFAPGPTERRKAIVPGYGPVFRRNGMNLDLLAERAAEEGFLPAGSRDDRALYNLISRAMRGERVTPQYAQGVVEQEMETANRARFEDYLQADPLLPDDIEDAIQDVTSDPALEAELRALLAAAADEGIDTEAVLEKAAQIAENGNQDEYTRQAIADVSAARASRGDTAARASSEQGRPAAQRAGREAGQPDSGSEGDQQVLTAPTRADIEAQQDRAATADDRDQREQVRRESEAGAGLFSLTQEDGRQDTTGNLFDQPEAPPATGTEKPVSQMSAADLLRAAADKMETKPAPKIEDFGEKIGGARKDVWTSYRDSLDEIKDDEIAGQPLSKIWPQPDYQALLESGADPWTVGFVRAARDEIPTKPRMPGKVKRWAEQVKMLRGLATDMLDGTIDAAATRAKLVEMARSSRGLLDIASRVELYMAVGHRQSLEGVRVSSGQYSLYKGVEYKPAKVIWTVEKDVAATAFSNWPRELASGDTREQAIANFKAKYDSLEIQPVASKEVSFDIFSDRSKDGYFVGKKIGRNIATLAGPFGTVKEARDYRTNNQAELLAKLEKFREIPRERRDTNEPRVGEDMRNGQDATPQMFADAFGFRGVEFGNWVEQGKRQRDLNDAYDALMDMAAILGVPPRALSLNGQLGLAFGARGTGGRGAAAAHYERDFVAINLTKKEGAGSLGHEWWHALDNYFSRMRSQPTDMMTEGLDVSLASRGSNFIANTAVRREMVQAFGDVMRAIKNTAIKARSSKLDSKRTKEYWTTSPEMSARAFESYLISKLQDQNASNDYLANIVDEETWKAASALGFELDDSYPYPTAGEIPVIREAFDKFFQTVETKNTDQGVAMFARTGIDAAAFRRAFGAPEPMSVERTQQIVDELTRTWDNGPAFEIVATASDMPGGRHPSDARGLILNGTAYIVAANNPTRDAVARTLGHEAIGHYGLWKMLGEDGTRQFRRNVQLAIKAGNKPITAIRDKVRELYVDERGRFNLTPEQEADEIAAFAVEEGIDPVTGEFRPGFGFLKSVWAKIAAFLRDTLGLPVRFTNAELQGLLVSSMRGLQTGKRLDGAADMLVAAALTDPRYGRTMNPSDPNPEQPSEERRDRETAGRGDRPQDAQQDVRSTVGGKPAAQGWAGATRIRRGAGPLTVYRGSAQPLQADHFALNALGRASGNPSSGLGVWFTTGQAEAAEYGNVEPMQLDVRNPKVLRFDQLPGFDSVKEAHAWREKLRAQGHDGILLHGKGLGKKEVHIIAFAPEQAVYPGEQGALARGRSNKKDYTDLEQEALERAGIRGKRTVREAIRSGFERAAQLMRERRELWSAFRQGNLDQFHGIDRAVKAELGGLPTDQDPYVAARLANGGTSGVMRALLLHGQARWAANGQHLEKVPGTKGLLDILVPLGDDLNDWFGWMVGNRAAILKAEGRENNLSEAQIKALQGLVKDKKELFRKVAAEYAAFKRSVVDVAEQAGLIDPEGRKVWDFADYIPFYRQIDDKASFSATGRKGLAGQSSGIRVLKGGESALNDPMENLLMNFSRLIDASLKNNAISKTITVLKMTDRVKKVGYDMAGVVVPKEQVRKVLIEAGTPEALLGAMPDSAFNGMAKMWSVQAPSDPDVVRVMVGGKPQFYRVEDPLLLKALTSFVPFDFPGLFLARGAKRILTRMVTSTPDFMLRNFIRDSLAAQGITRHGFNPAKSLHGILKSYTESGAFEPMLFAGASFQAGNVNASDPTGTAQAMRRALRAKGLSASGIDSFLGSVMDKGLRGVEHYFEVSEAIENSNREAVYEATLSDAGNATAAAYEAKDLMDFSLRGSGAIYQLMADVLPFFNARVQGMYRLGRADPKRLLTIGTLIMVATLLLAMANDGEDWYEELEDWDKDTYWHFKISGKHFRLPKPFEIGVVFATFPERIGRSIKGLDSRGKTADRAWANVRDQLSIDPVPQVIKPPLEVWANKDRFRDRPIETMADEGKLPSARFNANTSDTARVAALAMAPVSDTMGLSPKAIQHMVNGYFGTVGAYSLGLSDMLIRKLEGQAPRPESRLDDLPVIKSFYREDPARATLYESELYKMRDEVTKISNTIRAYRKADDEASADALERREEKKLDVKIDLDQAAKQIDYLRKDRDEIMRDRNMTPKEKRRAIDELQLDQNNIAREVMRDPAIRSAR